MIFPWIFQNLNKFFRGFQLVFVLSFFLQFVFNFPDIFTGIFFVAFNQSYRNFLFIFLQF